MKNLLTYIHISVTIPENGDICYTRKLSPSETTCKASGGMLASLTGFITCNIPVLPKNENKQKWLGSVKNSKRIFGGLMSDRCY